MADASGGTTLTGGVSQSAAAAGGTTLTGGVSQTDLAGDVGNSFGEGEVGEPTAPCPKPKPGTLESLIAQLGEFINNVLHGGTTGGATTGGTGTGPPLIQKPSSGGTGATPTPGSTPSSPSTPTVPPKPDPCGKDAIDNVTKCCGKEIYDEATKANGGKPPTIQYGTPSSGFDAETDTSTGTITVSSAKDKCFNTESVFFELANLAAKPKFDQIDKDAAAGNTAREDYALANERVEYDNVQKALAATAKCKKKWGCDKYAFEFEAFRPAKNFKDYYDNYLSKAHKDHYRNSWDSNYKKAYDAKHPPPKKHP